MQHVRRSQVWCIAAVGSGRAAHMSVNFSELVLCSRTNGLYVRVRVDSVRVFRGGQTCMTSGFVPVNRLHDDPVKLAQVVDGDDGDSCGHQHLGSICGPLARVENFCNMCSQK